MKKYTFSYYSFFAICGLMLAFAACQDLPLEVPKSKELAIYDSSLYELDYGYFPTPDLPGDNPITNMGVELGRMLFYETKLSKDNTQSCATCHVQKDGFSDLRQFSEGVEGQLGGRQAMAIFNMAWHQGFFWDGRAATLRDQALMPIQDPLEMNETLENVVQKLEAEKLYTDQFIRAFGDDKVSADRVALALEQFMLTIYSFDAKYDKVLFGEASFTESEQRGRDLFFTEFDPNGTQRGGECFHCHAGFGFTNHQFMNNGLDTEAGMTDLGFFEVSNNPADKAKFKVPSLRNIALTAPYMHDGRFATLEDVLDHYNTGVKYSPTIDDLMQYNLNPGLALTEQEKTDLIAFMLTLTDESFMNNEDYASPF
ncbi:MAG: cytochrome-c peroxidase [Bacteroidia bacterium]